MLAEEPTVCIGELARLYLSGLSLTRSTRYLQEWQEGLPSTTSGVLGGCAWAAASGLVPSQAVQTCTNDLVCPENSVAVSSKSLSYVDMSRLQVLKYIPLASSSAARVNASVASTEVALME